MRDGCRAVAPAGRFAVDRFMAIYLEEYDHEAFNRSLCTITSATVGLLELLVIRRIGANEYREIAVDFLARAQVGTMGALRMRLEAFGVVQPAPAVPFVGADPPVF